VAVYAGSSLAPAELVEAGDHEEIGRRAKSFVATLT
jgi:2-keto-3-deoxy-6-phosphogluconate aldolase